MSNRYRAASAFALVLVLGARAEAQSAARIAGKVLQAQGEIVTIDKGRDAGVKDRTVYDVFVDGRAVKLPFTNELCYVPQRVVAQVVIVDVEAKTAQGRVVAVTPGEAAPRVDAGANVFQNPFAAARNLPPFVKSIAAEPPRTDFGRPVTVKVQWSDDKDDLVAFDWTASGGTLSHARSAVPSVVWTPPLVTQRTVFKIAVTAFDAGGEKMTKSVDVESGPPGQQLKAYELRRTLADHGSAFMVCRDLAFDEENSAYIVDSDAVGVVGLDAGWNVKLRSEEYDQPFKQLDRIVVRGGDAYVTDLAARRAVRLRIGPKMYQDPPAVTYGGEGTGNGTFEAPADIAVDGRGDVYVLDAARGCVQIFTADGQFSGSIGSLGQGAGQLGAPVGLAIAHDGTLYVLDNGRKRVLVYRERRLVTEFEAGAQTEKLADLKVDPTTGRACVLETTSGEVRQFDASGRAAGRPFGTIGEGLAMGNFVRPARLKFDRLGSLYVISSDGKVIHRCDPGRAEEAARWGGIDFSGATDLAAGPNGDVAVLLPALYVAVNLDRLGWVKGICGGRGEAVGKLADPVAVAVDSRGYVCVLDQDQQNIQVFTPRGQPVTAIGKGGDEAGELTKPVDMTIDPSRRFLVVLDSRDDYEIKVYDVQAKSGEELRAALPGTEEGIEKAAQVSITLKGIVNVGLSGGKVESFRVDLGGGGAKIDESGKNAFKAGAWTLRGLGTPTSLGVTNLSFLVAADGTQVLVLDLGREGAQVGKVQDEAIARKPVVATADDYDRLYLWDGKASRAVEVGR